MRILTQNYTKKYQIRMPVRIMERLNEMAEKAMVSKAELIRQAIVEKFDRLELKKQ